MSKKTIEPKHYNKQKAFVEDVFNIRYSEYHILLDCSPFAIDGIRDYVQRQMNARTLVEYSIVDSLNGVVTFILKKNPELKIKPRDFIVEGSIYCSQLYDCALNQSFLSNHDISFAPTGALTISTFNKEQSLKLFKHLSPFMGTQIKSLKAKLFDDNSGAFSLKTEGDYTIEELVQNLKLRQALIG